jgi:hypothetical protein
MQIDRTKITKGMHMTSGPPADLALTKVFVANVPPTIEETDEKFDEAGRLQELLAKTKKAIDALKTKP